MAKYANIDGNGKRTLPTPDAIAKQKATTRAAVAIRNRNRKSDSGAVMVDRRTACGIVSRIESQNGHAWLPAMDAAVVPETDLFVESAS